MQSVSPLTNRSDAVADWKALKLWDEGQRLDLRSSFRMPRYTRRLQPEMLVANAPPNRPFDPLTPAQVGRQGRRRVMSMISLYPSYICCGLKVIYSVL